MNEHTQHTEVTLAVPADLGKTTQAAPKDAKKVVQKAEDLGTQEVLN